MTEKDFEVYKAFDKEVIERAEKLLKKYHDISWYKEDLKLHSYTVSGDRIYFVYNILDEYGISVGCRHYDTTIEEFCDPDCVFGEIRRWH